MSDSVANVEINDVLSSIRRLVRDESAGRAPAPNRTGERLVLEPVARVTEDPAANEADAKALEFVKRPGDLQSTTQNLEAALSSQTGYEPDTGDSQDSIEDSAPAFFRSAMAARDRGEIADVPAPGSPPAQSLTYLNVTQTSSNGDAPDSAAAPVALDQKAAVQADAPAARPMQASPEPLQLTPEAMVPAGSEEDDLEDEEVLLDEETLRLLVRSIVREELQGALGENITRNLRRLIRREIHKYFDVKDNA